MSDDASMDKTETADKPAMKKVSDNATFDDDGRILCQEERAIMDAFVNGMSIGAAADRFHYSTRTLRRWLAPDQPLGRALREFYQDRRDQIGVVRKVMLDPKTPPSTRLASVVMLAQLTGQESRSRDAERFLNEGEVLRILHERVRRRDETG